ncbi:hypothetical protein HH212_12035 [Massilia forsythiae]|uniref:Uncharacterized protein n=1 Tax=Massilia forsythiae TaxID=2728020 RepID=A0A7Z2VWZ3_9BURK|nr:hypothetical protein [Massilia forsythiae]QJE00659.1 hypothetical protein HH212_12035 [Massilia forsythiae]
MQGGVEVNQVHDKSVPSAAMRFAYTITPRPARVGGGWRLQLIEDGQEVGGGVYPMTEETTSEDAYQDAMDCGEEWLMSREPHAHVDHCAALPAPLVGQAAGAVCQLGRLPAVVAGDAAVPGMHEAMERLAALDTLSAMLWLYRRLARAYGHQAHADPIIERLAREAGVDVAQRRSAPATEHKQEK